MSYQTEKYVLWVLLCLPVLIVAVKGFADIRVYNKRLVQEKKKKAEQLRQAEQQRNLEEQRRRAFDAEYRNSRGGRF